MLLSHEKIQEIVKKRLEEKLGLGDKKNYQINEGRSQAEAIAEKKAIRRVGNFLQKVTIKVSFDEDSGKAITDAKGKDMSVAMLYAMGTTKMKQADWDAVTLATGAKATSTSKRIAAEEERFTSSLKTLTNSGSMSGALSTAAFVWAEYREEHIPGIARLPSPSLVVSEWNSYRSDLGWPAPEDGAAGASSRDKGAYLESLVKGNIQSTDGMTVKKWAMDGGTIQDFLKFMVAVEGKTHGQVDAVVGHPGKSRWPEAGSEEWEQAKDKAKVASRQKRIALLGDDLILANKTMTIVGSSWNDEATNENLQVDNFEEIIIKYNLYANGDIVISEKLADAIAEAAYMMIMQAAAAGEDGTFSNGDSVETWTGGGADEGGTHQAAAIYGTMALLSFLSILKVGEDYKTRTRAGESGRVPAQVGELKGWLDTTYWLEPITMKPSQLAKIGLVADDVLNGSSRSIVEQYGVIDRNIKRANTKMAAVKGGSEDISSDWSEILAVLEVSKAAYGWARAPEKAEGDLLWATLLGAVTGAGWVVDEASAAWKTLKAHWDSYEQK